MELNKLHNEDCLLTMQKMADNFLDCIVTDPPYGYSFMGKDWDKVVPSVEIWSECLRVLKPGAFAFIMSAPRQDVLSRMIINLDKAGFDTSFTSIYWAYASGFPKAMNISKAVDKKLGVEREVVGKRYDGIGSDSGSGRYGFNSGDSKLSTEVDITIPASEDAKRLDGSYAGFQPKPAVEIIIVVMKPIAEKSLTEQALDNGKGITWLDDCRVPTNQDLNGGAYAQNSIKDKNNSSSYSLLSTEKDFIQPEGRFPANLIVSDDVLNDGKVYAGAQGEVRGDEPSLNERGNIYGDYRGYTKPMKTRNDEGSFSRYYDLDKWWEERIKSFPKEIKAVFPFLITPKAAKSEKNFGLDGTEGKFMDESREIGSAGGTNPRNRGAQLPRKNYHPTVKPIKLMSYLIVLGSRENDIIYDPFAGTATTLIASRITGRTFAGSEINKEYFEIAEKRLHPFMAQTILF